MSFTIITGFSLNKKLKKVNEVNNSYKSFALLELYTSEGCSSCPSADVLLPQLAAIDSNVITLSFHVDYWNRLGWNDKFSSSEFTERQRQYGDQLHLESIYTPQLIINGQYELVGSDRSKAETDIRNSLKEKASVQLLIGEVKKEDDKLKISCNAIGDLKNQNIFAALIQKHAETNVRGGENSGRKLSHTNIVRSFIKKPAQQKNDFEISLPNDIAENNWSIVLFTQNKKDLKVTGVTKYQ
jgi:hypothetical protein